MHSRQVQITNPMGVHARPAARIAGCARGFESEIHLRISDGRSADAKSIMSIMMLALRTGTLLEIRAEGPDEEIAVTTLVDLVEETVNHEESAG